MEPERCRSTQPKATSRQEVRMSDVIGSPPPGQSSNPAVVGRGETWRGGLKKQAAPAAGELED